jgi:sugar/nucleoside kinase (ribokinase family)
VLLGVQSNGMRTPQPLPNPGAWFRCFDFLQVNEDEMSLMASDPMALAATAFAEGVCALSVTLGKRGVVYFAAPGFERIADLHRQELRASTGAIRTARLPAKPTRHADPGDPTGCGDVWGATYFSRLLAGDKLDVAIDRALDAAARNVDHRGATGLADYLRGELSIK